MMSQFKTQNRKHNKKSIKGRGAASKPDARYLSTTRYDVDDGWNLSKEENKVAITVTIEKPMIVIARNKSPDIPFEQSINPYRGCEHGCIYCYARPTHAYFDLSPGLDFETKLFAKSNAAELFREGIGCLIISMLSDCPGYQYRSVSTN